MKNYLGFTIAEVLITLGIIGIVAAMTLPSIINNSRNKHLEASLKKNYSILQQAFDMYQAETGERLKGNNIETHKLKPAIIKYFDIIQDCGIGATNPNTACVPAYEIDNEKYSSPYKTYNNNTMRLALIDDGQFILKDGSTVFIENASNPYVYITIDVNGYRKNPNRWGHDLFTFQLTNDGRILPMGAPQTTFPDENKYCSNTSTDVYNGVGCTYKALTEKDYFKNLP